MGIHEHVANICDEPTVAELRALLDTYKPHAFAWAPALIAVLEHLEERIAALESKLQERV